MGLTVMAGGRVGPGVEGEFWVFEKQLFPGEAMHGGGQSLHPHPGSWEGTVCIWVVLASSQGGSSFSV